MVSRINFRYSIFDLKQSLLRAQNYASKQTRHSSPSPNPKEDEEKAKSDKVSQKSSGIPPRIRFMYPEFLPNPKMIWRNTVREKLERQDMFGRRTQIDIPEFYVGTIMAVTTSDRHAQGKINRFVGICIERSNYGLKADFTLRNIVDHIGVEIRYEMYDPAIRKIEVLRLEKRFDQHLRYLRDALPEYSTFSFDMEPEYSPAEVPVNPIKVKLKPRPWLERWERQDLQGVQDLGLPEKYYKRAAELATPWEKYDLVKQYRATIPEEEQVQIYSEYHDKLSELEITRKKIKRKQMFVKPKKTA